MAATKVADGDDQPSVTVVVAKIELDGIRPSAAVPPFGMCAASRQQPLSQNNPCASPRKVCGQLDGQYKLASSGFWESRRSLNL
jgi:hypothetical protein